METTYTNKMAYKPSQQEINEYFIKEGLTEHHAKGWFNKMESIHWKDKQGKDILNWRKWAGFKISDLKKDNNISNTEHISMQLDSVKTIELPQNLKELAEAITELYHNKTKIHNSFTNKVISELIFNYQTAKQTDNIKTETDIINFLKEITNKQGFTYDYLISDLDKKMK